MEVFPKIGYFTSVFREGYRDREEPVGYNSGFNPHMKHSVEPLHQVSDRTCLRVKTADNSVVKYNVFFICSFPSIAMIVGAAQTIIRAFRSTDPGSPYLSKVNCVLLC